MSPAKINASDLPAALRRKLSVPASPSCSGEGVARSDRTPLSDPAGTDLFACHTCGQTNKALEAAQRHADNNRHFRFDWRTA